MKNIKYISKVAGAIAFVLLFATYSCMDDDSIERTGKPAMSIASTAVTVNEGESAVFNIEFEYPVNETAFIRIDVIDSQGNILPTTEPNGDPNSGNGYIPLNMEDFTVPYDTWFDSGFFSYGYLGGSGYVAEVPAFSDSFQLVINADLDDIPNEQAETFNFRLSATSTMPATIDEEISVTINNVNACVWTLETNDAYGDGWNGGFITATINGTETTYAAAGNGSTFEIGMLDNDVYSFSYTSGGGTGQAPGWEEENTFTLTAPDGTEYSDGPIPNEGEIVSGTNICPN